MSFTKMVPLSTTIKILRGYIDPEFDREVERAIAEMPERARVQVAAKADPKADFAVDRATVTGTPSIAYGMVGGTACITIVAMVKVDCSEYVYE